VGQIFCEYASGSNQSPAELEEAVRSNPALMEIFNRISTDPRFNPPNDSHQNHMRRPTLNPNSSPKKTRTKSPMSSEPTGFWNIWTVLLLVMVALGLYRVFIGPFK
ncbi:MAG: hypothetical protein Q7S69_06205, partial [Nitrosomonadaceae bacterium]|nr:hypothetical protein [Nitrosomonadaceae bacterium]